MPTLVDKCSRLDQLLSAVEGAADERHIAESFADVEGQITNFEKVIGTMNQLLAEEALPIEGQIESRQVETVLTEIGQVKSDVEAQPTRVREGTAWTALRAAANKLIRQLRELSVSRWSKLVESSHEPDIAFAEALPPETRGAQELREVSHELGELRDGETPTLGAAEKLLELTQRLDGLTAQLKPHAIPEELQTDWELLTQGDLPQERYSGELRKFVEARTDLASRIVVGLRPAGD